MRHEINEYLWIETGVTGDDQEHSHANGTLQGDSMGVEFTVHTHVGVPGDCTTEEQLLALLADKFGKITDLGLEIAFEIQLGPGHEVEEEDDEPQSMQEQFRQHYPDGTYEHPDA